jgi:hypothetical protein
MKTSQRPYEDPALHEALREDNSGESMLNDDFEQQVMKRIVAEKQKRPYFRVAATIIGVLMLSGLAFAAYHITIGTTSESQPQETTISTPNQQKPVEIFGDIVMFDNVQLDSVLTVVAQHYQKQVEYHNEAVRQLHFHIEWNQAASLSDFITLINNFEGVSLHEENDTIIAE